MLSEKALLREAKIIARRLHKQQAWLENLSGSHEKHKWVVVSAKTRRKSSLNSLSRKVVSAIKARHWLKADATGCLRLTANGTNCLLGTAASDGFVAQHQRQTTRVIKDPQGLMVSVKSNETESPLGWMRARKDKTGKPLINQLQFEAGEKIRRDFTMAHMSARVTASWDFSQPAGKGKSPRGEGAMEISERALAAKQRLFRALDFLGPEMSGIVFEVCCLASGLEAAERQLNWPRRSAKLVLQIALGKLSEHYGFVHPADQPPRNAIIQHWGREGYRPDIPPAEMP